jgi:hypothetical protein
LNQRDAISAADLEPGDWVPTEYCEGCGQEMPNPTDSGRCALCEKKYFDFVINVRDPRRI